MGEGLRGFGMLKNPKRKKERKRPGDVMNL